MSFKNFEDYKKATAQEKEQFISYSEAQKNLSESEKSKSEAQEAKKHFTEKPSFYISIISALIPSILAVIAFYGTNAREFFDNQARKMELDKKELDLKIEDLEKVKENLQQESLDLVNWHEERKIELDEEYEQKKIDLEKEYDNRITSLENEIGEQNKTLQDRLNNINTSNKTINELKQELVVALNEQKSRNEIITRLSSDNENLNQKITNLNLLTQNLQNSSKELKSGLRDYELLTLKNKILIYLLNKDWIRVGYNRIREDVDPTIRSSDIDAVIGKYKSIFTKVTLSDSNDPTGIKLRDNLTSDKLLE